MLSRLVFPLKKKTMKKSPAINISEISIVIPVKDNQEGIDNFLTSFFVTQQIVGYPKEIIIVDNLSEVPIKLRTEFYSNEIEIVLIKCDRKGPASARNKGVEVARGSWLLFLDSDCLITEDTLKGYLKSCNSSIAYAGMVKSLRNDYLSRYYEQQEILMPLKIRDENGNFMPQYLITANCLVWKTAFHEVGGFNEKIQFAGGEDIDLGLRLSEIGNISFAFDAIIYHDFNDGLMGFWKRFIRYGKGNRIIEEIYDSDLSPRLFRPNKKSMINEVLAKIQWLGLKVGYEKIKPNYK
jgi:glycosyltransferase involved in cell wall biosynthesis